MRRLFLPFLFGLCILRWLWPASSLTGIDQGDETHMYLWEGALSHHLIPPDWGPFYAFWYRFLLLFNSDVLEVYYLSASLILVLVGLLQFLFLHLMAVPPFWNLCHSLLLIFNPYFLLINRRPNHFALACVLGAFCLAARSQKRSSFLLWVTLGFLVASYVRPEYFLSFLFSFLWTAGLFLGGLLRPDWKRAGGGLAGLLLLLGLLIHFFRGTPLGLSDGTYNKSLDVFFSKNFERYVAQERMTEFPPPDVHEFSRVLYKNPENLTEALIRNPREFLQHISFNLEEYLRNFFQVFLSYRYLLGTPFLILFSLLGLLLLFLRFVPTRFHRIPLLASPRTWTRGDLFLCLGLSLFPFILSALLFGPLPQYMVSQFPLLTTSLILLGGMSFASWKISSAHRMTAMAAMGLLAFIPPRAELLVNYSQNLPGLALNLSRAKTDSLFLSQKYLCRPLHMLADFGPLWPYIQWPSRGQTLQDLLGGMRKKREGDAELSFLEMMRKEDWNLIFMTPPILSHDILSAPPKFRRELESFVADPKVREKEGFLHLVRVQEQVDIYIKRDLLEECGRDRGLRLGN